MRRYWVYRADDGEMVGGPFDHRSQAERCVDALEGETDRDYTIKPATQDE